MAERFPLEQVYAFRNVGVDVRGVAKGIAEDGGLQVDCGGRMEVFTGELVWDMSALGGGKTRPQKRSERDMRPFR